MASCCRNISLICLNCAHQILFSILTLKSVLELIFRLLNDTNNIRLIFHNNNIINISSRRWFVQFHVGVTVCHPYM